MIRNIIRKSYIINRIDMKMKVKIKKVEGQYKKINSRATFYSIC